ncbi:DUF2075 domain-containing protein [Companilactobacillus allii]|uniref:DNA replication initiation protein n=1 Tax=Companilactobacillus allii TaxID=1847728 RepID=A0A1P8Q4K3_9LACO|nr:DUF2075 domain-containing protein [Companilactobacillus allii]APX72796.1 DNA replication initiation protein [Companilactobacillus allii]USQ67585.1 DUF2075 domain-containing protein [Companilactobacillus allii]
MLDSVLPNKHLTDEQQDVFKKILAFCKSNSANQVKGLFQLNGDAGTGKSVILTQLFLTIEQNAKKDGSDNYFLVNHPELLKVYQDNATEFSVLRKNRFLRPTSFINTMNKNNKTADIVVIDEAHLLLSETDKYNNFEQNNQLEEIIKLARTVIIVYDENQVLKLKSYWSQEVIDNLVKRFELQYEMSTLRNQMRMLAPDSVINWINDLTRNLKINPIYSNNTEYIDGSTKNYKFRIYNDAEKMYQQICRDNDNYKRSRIVATADYPSTLDGNKHYVNEGNFHLPWDQYNYDKITWAQKDSTINEIGSIYTVQGFDLNYVGVIMGPSIEYAGDGKIRINIDAYEDQEAFKKRHNNDLVDIYDAKEAIILNSMNVLLKRGVKGVYIYFHDSRIYDFLEKS